MIEALIICIWSIVANSNDTSGLLVYLGYVSGTNFSLINGVSNDTSGLLVYLGYISGTHFSLINGVFPFKVMVKIYVKYLLVSIRSILCQRGTLFLL